MTDTAVDLAFLLGNLSNAEESIRLLLGDAFTFIPEEEESVTQHAPPSDKNAHEVSEEEALPPELSLADFEEDDAEALRLALRPAASTDSSQQHCPPANELALPNESGSQAYASKAFIGSLFLPPPEDFPSSNPSSNSLCLPTEVFAPTNRELSLLDSSQPASPAHARDGNLTSKSAGAAQAMSGCASPGWSTGRNSAVGARVMSFQKAQCFKTRQCRFWLDGRCTRGDDCTFAHCGTELREKPNLIKTKICSKWKLGNCAKQQHECSYAHGLEDLRVLPTAGVASPASQLAYNDFGF
eukprot:Gregarina_sp_Pseudo_9__1684@NODE_2138_length_1132_cov_49_774931_g1972_i0_p2_GENE_NODE_2138_length_1132_cov_49_774931_g1972_i0NODE_2138_length_1132_cov_49_774931_g1972_i0_p2_ORF_typecomplete_len298_score85_40zfCCCH_3/PF15663_5/2_9e09zfCCCH/PF00642_24/6_6e06zfCCCH/PF00642_24/0_025zf_CCCH_4/PF18345_1/5_6e09zf_CCCH_4/PF18345_1/1_8e02zf_CCCH_4/PF18345_1/2_7e03zfCCCH_4/PF18044_1/1_3e06zfCCCH_4/PF18044_1/5_8e02Torus/PF16131_5/0_013Torus/PF16131_5/0_23zfCCCH_2/PF14608_6/0_0003zfCCCH_2/PF14608_6/1_2e03Vp